MRALMIEDDAGVAKSIELMLNDEIFVFTGRTLAKKGYLAGKEYQMLELLTLRKGSNLSKEVFLNHLYGDLDEPEGKIIDVFICKKLREETSQRKRRSRLH